MPLFTYHCKGCGTNSEMLVRAGARPACPKCGSKDMEKQASRFAAMSASTPEAACASGMCPSAGGCPYEGGCCMN